MRHRLAVPTVLVLLATLAPACGGAPTTGPATSQPAGSQFRLGQDAAIFPSVPQLIDGAAAGQPLWVEMYELGRAALATSLRQARDRGADVRVIVDRTVPESGRTADRLLAAGVAV